MVEPMGLRKQIYCVENLLSVDGTEGWRMSISACVPTGWHAQVVQVFMFLLLKGERVGWTHYGYDTFAAFRADFWTLESFCVDY